MRRAATTFQTQLSTAMIALTCAVLTACGGSSSSSTATVTVPGAPTIGAATAGDTTASIAFTAPSSDGGASITSYTATCTAGTTSKTGSNTSSPISVPGLTNGTSYSCTVTATNSAGTSAASGSVSVAPVAANATVPGAPTIGAATAGDSSASIAFTAPTSNGGAAISLYTATCTGGGATKTGTNGASPVTVGSLTNGTNYTCSVTATNTKGTGAASGTVGVTPTAAATITAAYSANNTVLGAASTLAASSTPFSGSSTNSASTDGVGCNMAGTGTTVTGVKNSSNTSNITSDVSTAFSYSWSCAGGKRTLTTTGVPNHAVGVFPNVGNPNTIGAQTSQTISYTLAPTKAAQPNTTAGVIGYGLGGIKFDPNTGGSCVNNATSSTDSSQCTLLGQIGTWSLEALPSNSPFDFGADKNFAHVQPPSSAGIYHYHGAPAALFAVLGGTEVNGVPNKMVLIGWARDGYPIYYKYGYKTANDATSGLVALKGSYLPNSTDATSSTRPSKTIFPLGTFLNDWQYNAGTGDLDKCNGRDGVTPEFPNGIYYYVVTDTYPFAPRCTYGN